MSSVVRACVRRSLAYVCLSYVQPSRGKTFAYLRSSALLYEPTSPGETSRTRGGGGGAAADAAAGGGGGGGERVGGGGSERRRRGGGRRRRGGGGPRGGGGGGGEDDPPPSFPSGEELRLPRSVILRLCPRNETFLKNARFILALGIPRIHRVLTGCPANRIYRTVRLYRTPPLNVPLN